MGRKRGDQSPKIEDFRVLLALAEHHTEKAAAAALGITQPDVNRGLKKFREGTVFVETEKNRVHLTQAGRDAIPAVRNLLRIYDHLEQFRHGQVERPCKLTIGVGATASQFFLARALVMMHEKLPGYEIATRVARGKDRIAGVMTGVFDLAIVTHSQLQIRNLTQSLGQENLKICELSPLNLCVVTGKNTTAAQQLQGLRGTRRVPLSMLGQWRIAGLDSDSGIRQQLEERLADGASRGRFGPQAGGWLGVKEFVKQGKFVGLVPLGLLNREDEQTLVIRRLDDSAIAHRVIHRAGPVDHGIEEAKAVLRRAALACDQEVEQRWRRWL